MSPRDWRERIQDILEAISEIQEFTRDINYEAFRDDIRTVRSVEMNFIIIGESANQIPAEVEEKYPEIPWNLMRAMRNRIVHVYFQIDEKLLWDTIQNDLPFLIPLLKQLL
jgi:uncharacterized protein with HEPN domain